jgi:hypothetical protein
MFNKIKSVLKSSNMAAVLTAGASIIGNPKSKALPPVALGGSIALGILTTLFTGYKIADCIRYQTTSGQCDQVIKENLPTLAAGIGTLSAGWGGFNTFNPKLHEEPLTPAPFLPTKELVLDEKSASKPVSLAVPHPEVIKNLRAEGNSQAKIAEMLGISIYAVRKALKGEGKKATKAAK